MPKFSILFFLIMPKFSTITSCKMPKISTTKYLNSPKFSVCSFSAHFSLGLFLCLIPDKECFLSYVYKEGFPHCDSLAKHVD